MSKGDMGSFLVGDDNLAYIPEKEKNILEQYTEDATRTASCIEVVEVHSVLLFHAKNAFILVADILDQIKKNVFYGKPYDIGKLTDIVEALDSAQESLKSIVVNLNATPKIAVKIDPDVFHGIIGIATESGELLELMHQNAEQPNRIFDEIGDHAWYTAVLLKALKGDWYNILKANIAKLKARYPDKFTSDHAINRDVTNEKLVLDKALGA